MSDPRPLIDVVSFSHEKPLSRRSAMLMLGGAVGGVGLSAFPKADAAGTCTKIATEVARPFPSDGTNTNYGVTRNVLTDPRVIRRNITRDLGSTTAQAGIPLKLVLKVQNVNGTCGPLSGYYVYIWHCSHDGHYSNYAGTMNGGNYFSNTFLRGVQKTDEDGKVVFRTIFPGRYSGRATHIHVEVYSPSAGIGTDSFSTSAKIATSQFAFPASITDEAYADDDYASSAANDTTNEADGIFHDGTSTEMLRITGDNDAGYVAKLTFAVAG